ncbi:MAG: hypothetical protein IJ642_03250 [Oscillospiraceae bacterium]|nr:hypothetical protein [Oscillospiraceae bacterium]
MDDWKSTAWQERALQKPVRYWIRDEIEEIIKEEKIDRKKFHEYSKFNYDKIIRKFYYTFCDYQNFTPSVIPLTHNHMHIRKDLHSIGIAGVLQTCNWTEYLHKIRTEIPESAGKCFLILSEGWVYEGCPEEIFQVLNETDGWLDDFIILSNRFDWFIIHDDIAECAILYYKKI